jgi:hypothetical protein
MTATRNGDHRNGGHVLDENQQTRLEADSEAPEATSKSKVYQRAHSSFSLCQEEEIHKITSRELLRTHVMSRVEEHARPADRFMPHSALRLKSEKKLFKDFTGEPSLRRRILRAVSLNSFSRLSSFT